jgi:hypothetical protein
MGFLELFDVWNFNKYKYSFRQEDDVLSVDVMLASEEGFSTVSL